MKIIKMPRGTGKTLELIKMSHKTDIPIVVGSYRRKIEVTRMARNLKLIIPEVITMEQLQNKHPHRIYVDDLEYILQITLCSYVEAATVTGSNPLQVLKHRLWVLFRKRI